MQSVKKALICLAGTSSVILVFLQASVAQAVVAPSTWTSVIQVQGEDPNLAFDDWASEGVPVATTDAFDNPGFIDINEVQIANDDEFIYIHVTYHNNNSAATFLSFDLDEDPNTGFDIFGLGLQGSELGYSADYPFEQADNVFNTGDPMKGGPVGNGGALIWPYWDMDGPEKEYAIPLDAVFTNDVTDPNGPAVEIPVFASDTFNLMVYTDQGLYDITEVITYTLATNPNPCADGDFDCNGRVDALDFLQWQEGNSPNNGSSGDLALWTDNFGMPIVGSATGVPEPCSIFLVLAAIGMASRLRSRI